jgi:rhodanese-related sulfurtransferase
VQDLKSLIDGNSEFQLIDVREPYENDISSLNGELIPLAQVVSAKDKISRDKKVVIYCRSGKRSADAIRELETLYHFDNLYNLTGGINAFAKEVDETMKVY